MIITDRCMIISCPERFFSVKNDISRCGIIFPYGKRFFPARDHSSLWKMIFPGAESFFLALSDFFPPGDDFYWARNGFSCSTNDFSLWRSHFSCPNNGFSRLMNDFSLPGMISTAPGTIFPGEKRFFSRRSHFSGYRNGIYRSITLFTTRNDFFRRESLYLLAQYNLFNLDINKRLNL